MRSSSGSKRSAPPPWLPPRRRDDAHTHVLEAVIIVSIMISAVAYVSTFDTPTPPTTAGRAILQQKADDALAILYDTPASSSLGSNALSVYILECLQGKCTNLTDKLDRLIPPGASYALYISNGYQTYPVYVTREPPGEAVTSTRLIEPAWSSSFVATGRSSVNPATDPLLVYSLPVFNSNTLSQGGSPLRVLVHGTRLADGANYTLSGSFSTEAASVLDQHIVPAASMTWLVPMRNIDTDAIEAWVPGSVGDWYPETIDQITGLPTRANVSLRLRINETADVPIPLGTQVSVHVPRGWNATAVASANPAWNVALNATDRNATYGLSEVRATLVQPLRNGTVDLNLTASYAGDVLNVYRFHATLSRGALAEANLLAVADGWPDDTQTFRAPDVQLSLPRPMGSNATTTWSIAIDIPYVAGVTSTRPEVLLTGLDRTVQIHTIEIIEEAGAKIFGNVTGIASSAFVYHSETAPPGAVYENVNSSVGTWTSTGDRLTWSGDLSSDDGPLSLTFLVDASGVGGSRSSKNPFVPPVKFDAWEGRLLSQTAAGLYRQSILPANASSVYGNAYGGYKVGAAGTQIDFTSNSVYRSTLLPGMTNYSLQTVATPFDSLYGSYVRVETPSVPVGGQVVLTADVQSMLFALADAGQSAGVKVRFYPPWSGNDREWIWEQPNLDTGLLSSQVTALVLLDVNGDGYPDPIIGTNNGRVLALDALTGARLQGRVFSAPISTGAPVASAAATVTHLSTIRLDGQDYIVVGTDAQSGLYVLGKNFTRMWSWNKAPFETVAIDASSDVSGDGRNDVIVAVRDPADSTGTYLLYVLKALTQLDYLDAHPPVVPIAGFQNAPVDPFFAGTGAASALTALPQIGPTNNVQGLAVSIRTLPGQSTSTTLLHNDPTQVLNSQSQIIIESPRHGIVALNKNGTQAYTFFGSPITKSLPFDHDGWPGTDLVAGSPAGYVFMLNGTVAAQPAYPVIPIGILRIKDAYHHDAVFGAYLTEEGEIEYTRDGWNTRACVHCDAIIGAPIALLPQATAITSNGSASFWLVGLANSIWYTVPNPLDPLYPMLVQLTPINATKVVTNGSGPVAFDLATDPHNFYDVHFGWNDKRHEGWIVGGSTLAPVEAPCLLLAILCHEALLMGTTDAGATWNVRSHAGGTLVGVDGGKVTATLSKVNFTTKDIGWASGSNGTLLRTMNGGANWKQIPLGITANILDVSCAYANPAYCLVVAEGGIILRSTNATAAIPGWTDISSKLGQSAIGHSPKSVGVVDESMAYVGARNMLLQTLDGGNNWTTLPMNYLENDVDHLEVFPDRTGFGFGGNTTNARVWYLHDYLPQASAYTVPLTPDIPAGSLIVGARVEGEVRNSATTTATVVGSATGGANWQPLGLTIVYPATYTNENGQVIPISKSRFDGTFTGANAGDDFRLRFDLTTAGTATHNTPRVRNLTVNLTYLNATTSADDFKEFEIRFEDTSKFQIGGSTAEWDTYSRELTLPVTREMWTKNVSGEALDIVTGYNVSGDWRNEVWVATGSVLAMNSPDYLLYAGSEDEVQHVDNRIYLLDGSNGSIIANTSSLGGRVVQLALSDSDGNGHPETLFATLFNTSASRSEIYALNATTLIPRWSREISSAQPSGIAAGRIAGPSGVAYIGTKQVDGASTAIPSRAWAIDGPSGNLTWSSLPDERGRYVVAKEIPTNWVFGPYVVEVAVQWTDTVTNQNNVSEEIIQSARFYDYFMVTPPTSLSPPSPVYNVHLVTWFRDWR